AARACVHPAWVEPLVEASRDSVLVWPRRRRPRNRGRELHAGHARRDDGDGRSSARDAVPRAYVAGEGGPLGSRDRFLSSRQGQVVPKGTPIWPKCPRCKRGQYRELPIVKGTFKTGR